MDIYRWNNNNENDAKIRKRYYHLLEKGQIDDSNINIDREKAKPNLTTLDISVTLHIKF